ELLMRWHTLGLRWREIIASQSGRLIGPLRDAILSNEPRLCANACDAVVYFREYDLTPALVATAEDEASSTAPVARRTLLELCELLYAALDAPRDYADRRDPHLIRRRVVSILEGSVQRFGKHRRNELLEAFLTVTYRDNAT